MSIARAINPPLPKDIWLNFLIPFMDNKTLIAFSAASKETRQLAFAELFKRPDFSAQITRKINSSTTMPYHRHFQEQAWWGYSSKSQLLRYAQIGSIGFSIMFLGAVCERSLRNYPPCLADYLFSPPQIQAAISTLSAGLIAASFTFRGLFLQENQRIIELYQHSLDKEKNLKERSRRLKFLRDELPKQSITTHSLFLKVDETKDNMAEAIPRPSIQY